MYSCCNRHYWLSSIFFCIKHQVAPLIPTLRPNLPILEILRVILYEKGAKKILIGEEHTFDERSIVCGKKVGHWFWGPHLISFLTDFPLPLRPTPQSPSATLHTCIIFLHTCFFTPVHSLSAFLITPVHACYLCVYFMRYLLSFFSTRKAALLARPVSFEHCSCAW